MKMIHVALIAGSLGLATGAQAQSPQIPTPVNPFPINPIATDGSPLPSQASKGSPYGYGYRSSLRSGRSAASGGFVGEVFGTGIGTADDILGGTVGAAGSLVGGTLGAR